MFARVTLSMAVAAGLVGLAGCGPAKLDVTRNYDLTPVEAQEIGLDPQPKPQKITVEYEATSAAVNVGIYNAEDVADPTMVKTSRALAAESGKKSGTVTAEVPANTAVSVVVGGAADKTAVTVRVTNRK